MHEQRYTLTNPMFVLPVYGLWCALKNEKSVHKYSQVMLYLRIKQAWINFQIPLHLQDKIYTCKI